MTVAKLLPVIAAGVLIGGLAGYTAVKADTPPIPAASEACLTCHGQEGLSMTFSNGDVFSLYVSRESHDTSVHKEFACTYCHGSAPDYHHPKLEAGSLREYQVEQYQTCQKCHADAYATYRDSIHGQALEQSNPDVPTCADCHSAHAVQDPRTAAFRIESVDLCNKCHGDREMMEKYGISTNIANSYLEDFHGKTVALVGAQNKDIWVDVAVCTDCHGSHNIQAIDSPDSQVIGENLAATCNKCHPGSTTNFPSAWLSHYQPSWDKATLVYLVQWFYRLMIPFVGIGLLAHVGADLWQSIRNKKRRA